MSYGGEENREEENEIRREIVEYSSNRAKADDFGRSVARVAVAQVCESMGFDGFRGAALDDLADIAIRYLCDLGRASSFNANLAGRTECNLFDIARGLEELESSQGYLGAFDIGKCLMGSGTVKDIMRFVDFNDEVPFAQPIPNFPVVRDRRRIPSFLDMGETPPGKHIPPWLPALPDPHTYIQTPIWNERTTDPRADKIEQARQRRKAERALLSLQQRLLLCNGSAENSGLAIREADARQSQAGTSNPFLAVPLKSSEKEVSELVQPTKFSNADEEAKNVSVLEAFAPAIEAAKGGLFDDGDGERRLLPEKRPAVNFNVRTNKKVLGEPVDLSLQKKGGGRKGSWIGRDDERDDKKRRAEFILRQSMENHQDLTQL